MNQFTEVTRSGLLKNVVGSFVAAGLGIILFLSSFVVLWVNEGVINLGAVAEKSVVLSTAAVRSNLDGELVAATGDLTTAEPLGDSSFLAPGPYLMLRRNVEMYAWIERKASDTRKNVGGSSTTSTTYTYVQEWTNDPDDSSSFKEPIDHENPDMPFRSVTLRADQATIGAYSVDPNELTFPSPTELTLSFENVTKNDFILNQNYLVSRRDTLSQPEIGDLRISYTAVPAPVKVTLFGQAAGKRIEPYVVKDNTVLYHAFTENRAAAINILDTEYTTTLWIFRGVGFLLMWIGLTLAFSPVNAFLNILPLAGTISAFLIGAATFVVALVLSIITIVIGIIAHNIWLLLAATIILGGAGLYFFRQRLQARQRSAQNW